MSAVQVQIIACGTCVWWERKKPNANHGHCANPVNFGAAPATGEMIRLYTSFVDNCSLWQTLEVPPPPKDPAA